MEKTTAAMQSHRGRVSCSTIPKIKYIIKRNFLYRDTGKFRAMFCPFCGEFLQIGFKFCPFCGRELPNAENTFTQDMEPVYRGGSSLKSDGIIALILAMLGGSGGMPPRNFLKFEPRKCHFLRSEPMILA